MSCTTRCFALAVMCGFAFVGCHSHEKQVADLQKEYDQLGQQYRHDCFAELTNVGSKLSPRCADEKQKLSEAWNRLQAERVRK
jgi:hypothetical protein